MGVEASGSEAKGASSALTDQRGQSKHGSRLYYGALSGNGAGQVGLGVGGKVDRMVELRLGAGGCWGRLCVEEVVVSI